MKNAKVIILVMVLLVLLLVMKTNFIDGFTPQSAIEEEIYKEVEGELKDGFFLSEKIIDISPLTKGELELLDEPVEKGYKVRVRQYFLHFFAYRERMLTY